MIDFDATVLAAANAAFGEDCPVVYLPGTGEQITLPPGNGIFNDQFQEMKFSGTEGVPVISQAIVLNVRRSLLPCLPVQTELFRIRGLLYAITNVEPDGLGDLRIDLRLAETPDGR